MFLSWVKNSILTLSLLVCTHINAETITTEGRAFFPTNISQVDSCDLAFTNAKKNALSLAGLEKSRFNTIDICIENNDVTKCELFQENHSYFDGGFIKSDEILGKEKIVGEGLQRECLITVKFEIKKYQDQPDPNFILTAELERKRLIEGDDIIIRGETSVTANLYLLGVTDKDKYIKLIPNQFEKAKNIYGKFQLPSVEAGKKYSLEAQLPSQSTDIKEITEYIILLATKKDFVLVDEEDEANFHKRLDELGRGNWRKRPLAYSIYKE